MHNNKIILSYCSNFNRIMSADFLEGDNLSLQLVKIYKDFIFKIDLNNPEDIKKVIDIDKTMGKYVEDYYFRKALRAEILTIKVKKTTGDVIRTIVENIISIFKRYELESTRKIYISKWI